MKSYITIARFIFMGVIVFFLIKYVDYKALIYGFSPELLLAMMASQVVVLISV